MEALASPSHPQSSNIKQLLNCYAELSTHVPAVVSMMSPIQVFLFTPDILMRVVWLWESWGFQLNVRFRLLTLRRVYFSHVSAEWASSLAVGCGLCGVFKSSFLSWGDSRPLSRLVLWWFLSVSGTMWSQITALKVQFVTYSRTAPPPVYPKWRRILWYLDGAGLTGSPPLLVFMFDKQSHGCSLTKQVRRWTVKTCLWKNNPCFCVTLI